jgi:hypothetical protein
MWTMFEGRAVYLWVGWGMCVNVHVCICLRARACRSLDQAGLQGRGGREGERGRGEGREGEGGGRGTGREGQKGTGGGGRGEGGGGERRREGEGEGEDKGLGKGTTELAMCFPPSFRTNFLLPCMQVSCSTTRPLPTGCGAFKARPFPFRSGQWLLGKHMSGHENLPLRLDKP